MEFTVTLDAALALEVAQKGISLSLQPALNEAALYQERSLKARIYQEITPEGQPFAPLRPATLAQKKSGSILRETGVLVNAFLILLVSADKFIIRNPTFYAAYLQYRTRKMVARPFMGFSDADKAAIEKIVNDFVRRQLSL